MNLILSVALGLFLQLGGNHGGVGGKAGFGGGRSSSGTCTSLPVSFSLIGSGTLGANYSGCWTDALPGSTDTAVLTGTGLASSTGTGITFSLISGIAFPSAQSNQGTVVSGGAGATGLCVFTNSIGSGACWIGLANVNFLIGGSGGVSFACGLTAPQVSGDVFKISQSANILGGAVSVDDITRGTNVCTGTAPGTITGTVSPAILVDNRSGATGDRISNIVAD